jgi:hypothetical protein
MRGVRCFWKCEAMLVFLRSIAYGAVAGVILGLIIAAAGYIRDRSQGGGGHDEHGYATFAAALICGILGGMCGAAAGVGAYLKKRAGGSGE